MAISKETFCKVLRLIKEQDEINSEFSAALDKVGNGYFVFGTNNKYLEALLMVIKEALPDKYNYVEWWLYDTDNSYTVWAANSEKSWCLKEPEDLYDYIITECMG